MALERKKEMVKLKCKAVEDNPEREIPEFFVVYLPEYSSERMLIPQYFVKYLNRAMPAKTVLRNSEGQCWSVEVEKTRQGTFFQDGWKLFVEENSIQEGEFMVFRYGRDGFDCRVFGLSMCEKNAPSSRKGKEAVVAKEEEEEEDDDDDDYDYGDDDGDGGKGEADDHHEDEVRPMQLNTSFVALKRPDRNKLRVPKQVIRDNNLVLESKMIFQGPGNWKCIGKVSVWDDGSTWIGNWRTFCEKFRVKEDDKCICEFVLENPEHECTGCDCFHRCDKIKVQIIRGNRA